MTQKPFTPKKARKLEKLARAANKLQEAISALDQAQTSAENWAEYETIKHFKNQIDEILSCDHGEAGLIPFINSKEE